MRFFRDHSEDGLKLKRKPLKKFNDAVLTGKREKRRIGAVKKKTETKISIEEERKFKVGDIVEIVGMLNQQLNGQQGVIIEWVREKRRWKVQIGDRISQMKSRNLIKSTKRDAYHSTDAKTEKESQKRSMKTTKISRKRKPYVKDPDDAFSTIINFLETVEVSSRFAERMDDTCSKLELLRTRFIHNEKLSKRQGLKISMMEKMIDRADPAEMGKAGDDAEKIQTLTNHVNNLSTQLEIMIDEHEAMSNELKAKNHETMVEREKSKEQLAKFNQVCQHLTDQLGETSEKLQQSEMRNEELMKKFNSQLLTAENDTNVLKLELENLRRENARLKNQRI